MTDIATGEGLPITSTLDNSISKDTEMSIEIQEMFLPWLMRTI